ncbi:Hpt domain-containing protein [Ruegeria arenilitoris]|uniref:Hpt domain-containing protein n=1 Tax=Ruegeria arenilitoris TaxID=1173585 RepID=UPI00147F116E|nr:Hpt domain-containing protein [Ruegeria arenilitoris]
MINWPRVKQLWDEVGSDEFEAILRIFLREVQGVILRLQQETERGQIEQNLHFLKGSASSLGFDQVSKLCQDGERRAAAGNEMDAHVAEIVAAFYASKTEFDTERKRHLR